MPEPRSVIAIVSAALQAVRTWMAARDARKTQRVADRGFRRTASAKLAREQGQRLSQLLPDDVLQALVERIERCWAHYREAIDPQAGLSPPEIDEATEALKRCLCTELGRINELNGSVPTGKLRDWWRAYCVEQVGSAKPRS